MTRPTRDQMLMRMAYTVGDRSTCSRLHVGTVIARDGRSLSLGYNGAPAGLSHCTHPCTCSWSEARSEHSSACEVNQPCTWAVHAEVNAIAWAARCGVSTQGADLFTTHQPCLPCAQLIINAGIIRVVWGQLFRNQLGMNLLTRAGVDVCGLP